MSGLLLLGHQLKEIFKILSLTQVEVMILAELAL